MFAANTYDEIIRCEKEVENLEIVVLLFVRPTNQASLDIIREFDYIHYNSGKYCSVYAIGYSNNFAKAKDRCYRKATNVAGVDWYFSDQVFVEFKNNLERRIKWQYSGETEIIVLQNNPGMRDPLNFQNYVAIDVNKGIKEGYMDSFQRFMESLVRSARSKVTAKEAIADVRRSRISIKDTIAEAISDSKKIPEPVKTILKDRLFYRCANK